MDLELVEEGNGGELIKNSKDLSVIYGFENMPFLAMFGGNVKMGTPSTRLVTEQAFDFWGNNLLMPNDSSIQFNSQTERALNTIPLTSYGRTLIQQAVEADLQSMADFANITVTVSIIATDVVVIGIRMLQPDNLQQQDFVYIWNATLQELRQKEFEVISKNVLRIKFFDLFFDLSFN